MNLYLLPSTMHAASIDADGTVEPCECDDYCRGKMIEHNGTIFHIVNERTIQLSVSSTSDGLATWHYTLTLTRDASSTYDVTYSDRDTAGIWHAAFADLPTALDYCASWTL